MGWMDYSLIRRLMKRGNKIMFYDKDTNQLIDKCNICSYRYACNEQDEYECQNNSYRRFELDKIKLGLYNWKEIR